MNGLVSLISFTRPEDLVASPSLSAGAVRLVLTGGLSKPPVLLVDVVLLKSAGGGYLLSVQALDKAVGGDLLSREVASTQLLVCNLELLRHHLLPRLGSKGVAELPGVTVGPHFLGLLALLGSHLQAAVQVGLVS